MTQNQNIPHYHRLQNFIVALKIFSKTVSEKKAFPSGIKGIALKQSLLNHCSNAKDWLELTKFESSGIPELCKIIIEVLDIFEAQKFDTNFDQKLFELNERVSFCEKFLSELKGLD